MSSRPPWMKSVRRTLGRLDARITSFTRRFSAAEKEIENIILRGIVGGELFKAKTRRELRSETQAILRSLYRERERAADDLLVEHFLLGRRIAEEGLRESISQSAIQKQALQILLENYITGLDAAIDTVGRRVDDVFRKEGLRSAQEMAEGSPRAVASARMRERLIRDGITSFVDSGGHRWTLTNYVRMATKTITSEAQNRATQIILVERGLSVVEVTRVQNPCKVCLPYNGEEVSLTGEDPGLMHLKVIPPFHPECRHFIFPTQRTVDQFFEKKEEATT